MKEPEGERIQPVFTQEWGGILVMERSQVSDADK